MHVTKISNYEEDYLLEKISYKIEKNAILFLNFIFGSENFVEIDWFLFWISKIYDIEMFQI